MITSLPTFRTSLFDNNCAPTRCSSFTPCFFNPSETSKKILFSASLILGTFLFYKIAVLANAYFSPPPPPPSPERVSAPPPSSRIVPVNALLDQPTPPLSARSTDVGCVPPSNPPDTTRTYFPLTPSAIAHLPLMSDRSVRSDMSGVTIIPHAQTQPPPTWFSRLRSFFR